MLLWQWQFSSGSMTIHEHSFTTDCNAQVTESQHSLVTESEALIEDLHYFTTEREAPVT